MDIKMRSRGIIKWVIAFGIFTALAVKGAFNGIDLVLTKTISMYANPVSDMIFLPIRVLGDTVVTILLVSAIAIYLSFFVIAGKRHRALALFMAVTFALLLAAGQGLKTVIRKERPPLVFYRGMVKDKAHMAKSFSYPSGHSLRATFLFFVLAMLVNRSRLAEKGKAALRWACYGAIILIGFSSIYLGAHWLSDVMAGSILGYIFFLSLRATEGSEAIPF